MPSSKRKIKIYSSSVSSSLSEISSNRGDERHSISSTQSGPKSGNTLIDSKKLKRFLDVEVEGVGSERARATRDSSTRAWAADGVSRAGPGEASRWPASTPVTCGGGGDPGGLLSTVCWGYSSDEVTVALGALLVGVVLLAGAAEGAASMASKGLVADGAVKVPGKSMLEGFSVITSWKDIKTIPQMVKNNDLCDPSI